MKQLLLKTTRFWALLFCAICVSTIARAGVPNRDDGNELSFDLKSVYIDMHLNKASVEELFVVIEEDTDYKFFYDRQIISNDAKYSMNKTISLYDVLVEVSKSSDLHFRQVNRNINVKKKEGEEAAITKDIVNVDQAVKVIGKVNGNDMPEGIPWVNVLVKGTTIGTVTDLEGNYSVEAPSPESVLIFSSIGYTQQEIVVGAQKVINVTLMPDAEELEEVVVTGYGQSQKKESMVSSITSVSVKDLKIASSNLTTALAGRIPGVISVQRSGEPGQDNSDFFIRGLGTFGQGKRDPLILIDNIESTSTDLARLQPDDIEAFSILKDATAAAVYGARGANGVILVNTKTGEEGATKFTVRFENRLSTNTRNFKMADNITFMELENESVLTRPEFNEFVLPNTPRVIDRTRAGDNPLLYPSNDWIDLMIKPYTMNQAFNISATGGGKRARYYIAGTYNVDNGVLRENKLNNFSNNIKLINYSLRSNVNIQLTQSLEGIFRIYGQFDDYTGPLGGRDRNNNNISGGRRIFNLAVSANPVKFPAIYPSSMEPFIDHPLFGGAVATNGGGLYANPYAELVKGYEVYKSATVQPQIELKQDLDFITPGLKVGMMGYVRRYSKYTIRRQYNPFFYESVENPDDGSVGLSLINHGQQGSIGTPGTETLDFGFAGSEANSRIYYQSTINYAREFDKHAVSGFLIYLIQSFETGNPNLNGDGDELQLSLPKRNQGISGKFTYGYDGRYLAEFNFGYNGTERFAKNNRYGFFPSFGLAYHISNESFWTSVSPVVDDLKFRFSYGFVGNDQVGNDNDRFFYLSDISLNNEFYDATFGRDIVVTNDGVLVNRYANPRITWEQTEQYNLGVDMTLFNSIDVVAEIYKQTRSSILETRSYIGSTMGLNPAAEPQANTGKAQSKGIDVSMVYNKYFGKDQFLQIRSNMTYAVSEILVKDEVSFPEGEEYRSVVGNSITQEYGYIAERLFVDDFEVFNSPTQFGIYRGGDLKYRDVNRDGVINDADIVPIGFPTTPEIIYGFGGTYGFKSWDLGIFFQGAARTSLFIDSERISPFTKWAPNGGDQIEQNGLLQVIADSHWSEEDRDVYAFWPRLSSYTIENNVKGSTWWMRNGSFLRLKSVELGYTLPETASNKMRLKSLRVYARGNNLYAWSKFKLWDVEMGGNGLGYPIQAVYALGLLTTF